MNRCIRRNYEFTNREVREILIAWMKAKDLPAPIYVGDTDTTFWSMADDGGIRVEWADDDKIDIETGAPIR